mmetsp:Transcript_10052/g.11689  ORF Transcript_10052/g.11689 Transcript_10052/m.11689 type:complete len:465 (+) Transcript_10052:243-1637(+)
MDLSTLIGPLVNLASVMQRNIQKGNSNVPTLATLDRTLGTVASLGLTLGLYRLLNGVLKKIRGEVNDDENSKEKKIKKKIPRSVWALIQILFRGILMGATVKQIKAKTGDNEKEGRNVPQQRNEGAKIRTFSGSCHCKSISFIVKAPCHIEAQDCEGKISYPHFLSNANNFQLISGTRFLSIYYVNLSDDEYSHRNVVAAHSFCSRCGVHILRAPNSHSNQLEVNTACLDEDWHNSSYASLNVTLTQNIDDMCMGKGEPVPLRDEMKQPMPQKDQVRHHHKVDADNESYSTRSVSSEQQFNVRSQSQFSPPWPIETVYEDEYESDMKWSSSFDKRRSDFMSQPSTPTTIPSTVQPGESSLSYATNDSSSTSDGFTFDEADSGYFTSKSNSVNISGWPVATSLQSLTPRNFDTVSETSFNSEFKAKANLPPSALMKDQLKYYLTKHITPFDNDIENKENNDIIRG